MSEGPSKEKMLEVAKTYAKNALTAREMTSDQLRTRMAAKLARRFPAPQFELDPDVVAAVVEEVEELCRSYSMIDDTAYSSRKAAAGVRAGKSKRMTAMSLKLKGIDGETAQDGLSDYDDLAAALNFLRKKKSGPFASSGEDPEKRKKALASFLRGGFAYSLWNRASAMTLDEIEEYLADTGRG
ncbi:RecX family transcriptional regulator [Pararhizobium sp. BT-229]|uniref:RecX family transcriptional regulator n=1 Tax=Pararhizobium sp. BT-229 TaxID=2986923 RepID=UPI0021F7D2FC|nr:RecX family transcriptional regulator [Pararhizobium sp. BT-229]MCV9964642.1 RecX family transcriptional regulator [Pararhizobium sp. BT-229]